MEILIKPIVTERMTHQGETLNKYGFLVHKDANKVQIRKAIEDMYQVTVESVNTIRYKGKKRMQYTRTGILEGRKPNYKKAIVTLVDGDSIDFFSNI